MRAFFMLLPLLCLRTAANDCTSLLSMQTAGNSTLRKKRYLLVGKCREVKEGGTTTIQDNHVNFKGKNGATLLEVHFSPVWYSITGNQPIAKDCVVSEDKIKRVKILAGRHQSKEVREDFVQGILGQPELQAQNMVASLYDTATFPDKLNFAFGGTMKFTFAQSDTSFSCTAVLRLAQGHYRIRKSGQNNWWIAGEDCQRQNYGNGLRLICDCGAGQIAIWPSSNDTFGVSPFP